MRYAAANSAKNSSTKFMKDIMTSGTLEDKVSALTLVIQESPLHNTKAFESLLGLARKKNRNQAIMALGALKDLLGSGVVLPPDRKLRPFGRQPGLISALQDKAAHWRSGNEIPGDIQEVHLIFWAYEDWLKRTYFEMLQVMEGWCNDEVEFARNRAVTFVWELLKEKPEQEENLLRLLVNKLGDTDKKVASRASHLLLQLQLAHPVMKSVIIGAVESDLLFRPCQSLHAKYYAIISLNQTILSQKEQATANKLLDIYFSIFVGVLKQEKYNHDPKVAPNGKAQGGGGQAGKKAKKKQAQKEAEVESKVLADVQIKDRLIAQVLTGINRAFPFADAQSATMDAHLDTLFRITHSSNFNTSIQALMLIYQITVTKQSSVDRYYRTLYESLLDPRLLSSSKQILYLNLLYKSLKSDINIKRVQAFVKRLLQVITLHEPSFACGVLYLIHELQITFPSIKTMLTEPEISAADEEENFVDAPDEDADLPPNRNPTAFTPPSDAYNPRKREPEYSNADRSCLWELVPLIAHYHPSVSLFASRLLQTQPFDKQKPDPSTFTLIHFLDRFIYRNARTKSSGLRGSSLMQPLAGTSASDLLIKDRSANRNGTDMLNTEAFWAKNKDDVRPDEVFFHDYFSKAGKAEKKSRAERRAAKAKEGSEEDGEGSEDEDGEKEIWKALVGSRPDIEDDGVEFEDEDEELDIGEFMDEDDEEEASEDGEEGGVGLGDVTFHGFEDGEDEEEDAEADDAGSDDGFGLDDLEDDDEGAFVDSDEELPDDVVLPDEPVVDQALVDGVNSKDKKKRKRSLKSLPVFASAEDYAKLIGEDDEEDY